MMKRNQMLEAINAKWQAKMDAMQYFVMQCAQDAAMIVMIDEFGFGEDRLTKFCLEFCKTVREMAALINSDVAEDKDMEYTKAIIDRKLKKALGKNFQPWDVRYAAVKVVAKR